MGVPGLMVIDNISRPDDHCHAASFGGRIPEKVDEGPGGGVRAAPILLRHHTARFLSPLGMTSGGPSIYLINDHKSGVGGGRANLGL